MPGNGSAWPLGRLARAALVLEVALGIGALAGGAALMFGEHGEIIPLKVASLAGSPFATFFVPGLILFAVLGLGPIATAVLVWLRWPVASLAVVVSGLGLLIWLVVQIAIIGYTNDPPIQLVYIVLGVLITAVGVAWSVLGQTIEGAR
jgi:hypothetical protein